MNDYRIGSIMPAQGYRAWGCTFDDGKPVVEELLAACLAVVQRSEGDRVEPLVEDGAHWPMPADEARRFAFQDSVVVHSPNEPFGDADKKSLIEQAKLSLERLLEQCEAFLKNPTDIWLGESKLYALNAYVKLNSVWLSLDKTIFLVQGLRFSILRKLGREGSTIESGPRNQIVEATVR